MGFYSGSQGSILFGRRESIAPNDSDSGEWIRTDTKITNWTLNTSAQLLDTTTLGDYDKSSVYGLRTHTGTLRLLYYTEPGASQKGSPATNSASWFINALMRAEYEDNASSLPTNEQAIESISVRLRLYLQKVGIATTQSEHDYLDVDANLTSISFGSAVGELVAVDASFESIGRIIRSSV